MVSASPRLYNELLLVTSNTYFEHKYLFSGGSGGRMVFPRAKMLNICSDICSVQIPCMFIAFVLLVGDENI